MTNGPLHDALHGAASRYEARYLAEDAAPAKGLAAQARRRRRTTLTASAVASVAILGVGVALAIPSSSADMAALDSSNLLTTVDVPLLDYAEAYSYVGGEDRRPPFITPDVASCGGPAPTTVLAADGFAWEPATTGPVEVSSGNYNLAPFSGWLTHSGAGTLPVTVEYMAFVLVADGKVVGFSNDYMNAGRSDRGFQEMRDGFAVATGGSLWGHGDICTPGGRVKGDFPPGEYVAYPILHIVATKQTAALAWLGKRGVLPPGTLPGDGVYEPGSWDCTQYVDMIGMLVQCDPEAVGVVLQDQSQTASVPYDSTVYVRDVDVTLVGDPVAVTVKARAVDIDITDFGGIDPYVDSDYPTPSSPDSLVCGETYGGYLPWNPMSETMRVAWFSGTLPWIPIADGTRELELLPVNGLHNGSVAYPDGVQVWFINAHQSDVEGTSTAYDDDGWDVVGTGYAEVNGGEPVTLSRYDGPSSTTVELTEVRSCGLGAKAWNIGFSGAQETTDAATGTTETVNVFGAWELSSPYPEWITGN